MSSRYFPKIRIYREARTRRSFEIDATNFSNSSRNSVPLDMGPCGASLDPVAALPSSLPTLDQNSSARSRKSRSALAPFGPSDKVCFQSVSNAVYFGQLFCAICGRWLIRKVVMVSFWFVMKLSPTDPDGDFTARKFNCNTVN